MLLSRRDAPTALSQPDYTHPSQTPASFSTPLKDNVCFPLTARDKLHLQLSQPAPAMPQHTRVSQLLEREIMTSAALRLATRQRSRARRDTAAAPRSSPVGFLEKK